MCGLSLDIGLKYNSMSEITIVITHGSMGYQLWVLIECDGRAYKHDTQRWVCRINIHPPKMGGVNTTAG